MKAGMRWGESLTWMRSALMEASKASSNMRDVRAACVSSMSGWGAQSPFSSSAHVT